MRVWVWRRQLGPEGLDRLGKGPDLLGIGGPADGLEDWAEGRLGLLGGRPEGLDGLEPACSAKESRWIQADGVEDGAEGGLGLLGGELGPEGLNRLGKGAYLVGIGCPADGVEDGAKGRLGLLDPCRRSGPPRGQGPELEGVGGPTDGVEDRDRGRAWPGRALADRGSGRSGSARRAR